MLTCQVEAEGWWAPRCSPLPAGLPARSRCESTLPYGGQVHAGCLRKMFSRRAQIYRKQSTFLANSVCFLLF